MSAFKFLVGSAGITVAAAGFNAALGKPEKIYGVPVWSIDDASQVAMKVADDGMSASFTDTGAPGSATVTVAAEGDPTAGVDPVSGQFTVGSTPEEADSLQFTAAPNAPAA